MLQHVAYMAVAVWLRRTLMCGAASILLYMVVCFYILILLGCYAGVIWL